MRMVRVGCGDYGSEFNYMSSDGSVLHRRKLRPLMPRPTNFSPIPNPNSSNCTRIHKANLSTLNENLVPTFKDQAKLDTAPAIIPIATRRWSPTPEQLHALKDMYRRGIRTPTMDQIHQITAKLRRFGRIEGKNVFYWFQNHKARERQRRRRMAIDTSCHEEQPRRDIQTLERRNPGLSGTGFGIGTTNKVASSNCSTLSEDSVSILRTAVSEKGIDGWIQFDKERQLQQIMKGSTETTLPNWKPMNPYSTPPIHFIHTANSTETTQAASGTNYEFESERRDNQTLQLFPIRSDDCRVRYMNIEVMQQPMEATDTSFAPNQFFEFLRV